MKLIPSTVAFHHYTPRQRRAQYGFFEGEGFELLNFRAHETIIRSFKKWRLGRGDLKEGGIQMQNKRKLPEKRVKFIVNRSNYMWTH